MNEYRFVRDPTDHSEYFLGTVGEYLRICDQLIHIDCCEVHSFKAKDRVEAVQYVRDNIYKDFV